MGRKSFSEGLGIVKSEGGCVSVQPRLATSLWPATRLAWNANSWLLRTVARRTRCRACGSSGWTARLAQLIVIESFYQKYWDQDIRILLEGRCLVLNSKPLVMAVKNWWLTAVRPLALLLPGVAGEQIRWRNGKRQIWFTSCICQPIVCEPAVRSKEFGERIEGCWPG